MASPGPCLYLPSDDDDKMAYTSASHLGEVLQPAKADAGASVSLPGPWNMAGGYQQVIWNSPHMCSEQQHSASINKATRGIFLYRKIKIIIIAANSEFFLCDTSLSTLHEFNPHENPVNPSISLMKKNKSQRGWVPRLQSQSDKSLHLPNHLLCHF